MKDCIPELNSRRLGAHGFVLALCLWCVFLWNVTSSGLLDRGGHLKGTDFLHFYTLGTLARAHRGADLYVAEIQSKIAAKRVPVAVGIRYLPLYPPQVSILFAPFARLTYSWALILWSAVSFLVYGACCYWIWRNCPNLPRHGLTVMILAFAFPAFWHLILWGQTSALALVCFTVAFFALRSDREFLAGLALGCLVFKPQLGLASAIVFLITVRWRVIAGAILSAATQLAAAFFYYGAGPLRDWIHALRNVSHELSWFEPRLYQTHCLRTFWEMLLPWPTASLALYLITAALVAGLMIAIWQSRAPLSLRYSALLLATVLISPHLTVYDLVVLAPAFLLLADWSVESGPGAKPGIKVLLYLAFVVPLLGPLSYWTHFQLSVPVMAAVMFELWNIYGSRTRIPAPEV